MTALLLQTLLLMVPAFFIGAALACGLRRLTTPARQAAYVQPRTQPSPVEPLPQYAERNTVAPPVTDAPKPAAAPAVNKFDQTLRPVEVRPAPPPPPAAPPAVAPAPRPEPAAPASATAEKIATAAAAMAAAAATMAAQANAANATAPAVAPPATTVIQPASRTAVAPATDDLTRISAIDAGLSQTLAKLGVTRFSQIAAWRKSDVDKISQALGYQGRIEQENWIEQAQILAGGGDTFYSARRKQASLPVAPTSAPAPAAVSTPNVEQRAAFAQSSPRPAAPPSTSVPVPPDRVAVQPAAPAAPARDGMSAGMAAAAAAAAAAAIVARPVPAASAATPAPAPVAPTPPPATAIRPTMAPTRDVLQRIGSISPELEKLLASQGITRYSQIASWGSGEIERFDRLLGSQGRIARENWVEQAQILAKGGDTAHSREYDRRVASTSTTNSAPAPATTSAPQAAPAAPTATASSPLREPTVRPKSITEAIRANAAAATGTVRSDIGGLRSVRSEAYRSAADAATAAAAAAAASTGSAKVVRSAEIDDLKRIRGIGVLIEKRLNQIGIVNYAQIAEWTTDDIDRVSATLDFKGRIERENWVEQARILSTGGHTEFSRRVDRGEVESSKPRPN